jgi:hypothetical protein
MRGSRMSRSSLRFYQLRLNNCDSDSGYAKKDRHGKKRTEDTEFFGSVRLWSINSYLIFQCSSCAFFRGGCFPYVATV